MWPKQNKIFNSATKFLPSQRRQASLGGVRPLLSFRPGCRPASMESSSSLLILTAAAHHSGNGGTKNKNDSVQVSGSSAFAKWGASSAHPALLHGHGLKLFDFCSEADPAVSVRLIAYMHNMGCTPHLLGGVPRYFRRHSNRHFQRHSDLQGRRRREEKTTTGNIQGLCKMLSLVRSYPSRSESQRRAVVEPGPLSTLNSFHFVLPHARKGLTRILAN